MAEFRIDTRRLVLREWHARDVEAVYAMGQDARVMRFFGPLEGRKRARRLVEGQMLNQSRFGHCFWPVERRSDRALLGFCGLGPAPDETPLRGGIEIAWRIAASNWGRGYAREAAEASLNWAWTNLTHGEVVSMTVAANVRSWGLMQRLGMTRRAELDFDHPTLSVDDPLRAHIVYSIGRPC